MNPAHSTACPCPRPVPKKGIDESGFICGANAADEIAFARNLRHTQQAFESPGNALHIDPETGLLDSARQAPSPNADARPDADDISLIVVHCISLPPGEFDAGSDWIERFFCNDLPADAHPYFAEICDMRVSAHVLIRRDGGVVQFVPFHRRAWHAGVSNYKGRERCNDFSVGVELEGTDDGPFEDAQYDALAQLVTALRRTYPRIGDNIAGHSDIAPGRKTDPGSGFDWPRLHRLIRQ